MAQTPLPQSVEEMTDIIDIEPFLSTAIPLWEKALIALGLFLVLSAFFYFLWKRYGHRLTRGKKAISPEEEFEMKMAQLSTEGLEKANPKLLAFCLSEILRKYLERVFHYSFLEKTTDEILADGKINSLLPVEVKEPFFNLLVEWDNVKYGGADVARAETWLSAAEEIKKAAQMQQGSLE